MEPVLEPESCSAPRVKLVPKLQQFWKSWDDVPSTVPEEFKHTKFFVEVFAGKAGLSRRVRRRRKIAVLPPIEIELSDEVQGKADILDPMVRRKLVAWMKAGVVQFVHFGTPCTSFSIARRNDGGPPPVRDRDNLYGFEKLEGYEKDLVATGTKLMQITAELCQLCSQLNIEWSVENPSQA